MPQKRSKPGVSLQGLALGLILTGSLVLFAAQAWHAYEEGILSFAPSPATQYLTAAPVPAQNPGKVPTRIRIPRVHINLAITPTQIVAGRWQISKATASYLETSSLPGLPGRTIIYGHNKNSLFGPIRWLRVGDTLSLETQDGTQRSYTVAQIQDVAPTAIEVLAPSSSEILTLYTCTGLLDSRRFVLHATPTP